MKNYLFLLLSFLLVFSCSDDDDNNGTGDGDGDTGTTANYFPIHDDNYWNYEGSTVATTNTYFEGQETFSTGTFLWLKNQGPIFGFVGDSYVRKDGNDYFLYSSISLEGIGTIDIENKKFLDEGSSAGDEINNFTLDRDLDSIPFTESGITATAVPTIHYNTAIVYSQHYDNITLNGSANYDDVIKVVWTFKMSADLQLTGSDATGLIDINYNHPLINEGQVGTLTQYFANNIGVVRSEFDMDYSNLTFNNNVEVSPLPAIDISEYTEPIESQLAEATYSNNSELTADYSVTE